MAATKKIVNKQQTLFFELGHLILKSFDHNVNAYVHLHALCVDGLCLKGFNVLAHHAF